MFKLRGPVTGQQRLIFGIIGFLLTLLLWYLVTLGEDPSVESGILPKPSRIPGAYQDLIANNKFFKNLCLSLGFNFGGYIKALLLSVPIGFIIALYPLFNATFDAQVNAFRFIPLTAVTSVFIAAFGIESSIKINFLAFGIMIYLVPIIIQRVREVQDVYLKTVYTLGASDWQTIKTVYFPSVMSRLSDDIRVLTAISWTYIIVAEQIGDQGGLGSLVYKVGQRMGRPDKTFAILLVFILFGLLQDRIFVYLDKKFFPHKYQIKDQYSDKLKEQGIVETIWDFGMQALVWAFLLVYALLAANELFNFLGGIKPLSYLFDDTVWVIHFIALSIISYLVYCFMTKKKVAHG